MHERIQADRRGRGLSHRSAPDTAVRPRGIMPNVKHEAATRAPTPNRTPASRSKTPPAAVLFLVSDLASRTATESLAINGGIPIELPGPIATA